MNYRAVSIARSWLGTPYLEGASVRGVGADCAGLLEGIGRELGVVLPSRGEAGFDLLFAAKSCSIVQDELLPGCILLLAEAPNGIPLHCAVMSDQHTLIHAHWRVGTVENRFGSWFARRVTHVFAWPNDANSSAQIKPLTFYQHQGST